MSYKFGKFWPLAIWPVVLFLLNPDWFIIPVLRKAGMPLGRVVVIAGTAALIDLLFTVWCWARTWKELAEVRKVRETRRQLKIDGWFDRRFVDYVLAIYFGIIDPKGKFVGTMKRWGLPVLFLLCASPLPGPRTPTAIFCTISARGQCLTILAICDLIHTVGVAYLWEVAFWVGQQMVYASTYLFG